MTFGSCELPVSQAIAKELTIHADMLVNSRTHDSRTAAFSEICDVARGALCHARVFDTESAMKTRRLFFLSTAIGLAAPAAMMLGAGFGCSSDPGSSPPATSNEGGDVKVVPPDAGPEEAAGPQVCPTTTPVTAADIEKGLGTWKAPSAIQNVCTQANIDAVKALFKAAGSAGVAYTDIKTALGAPCSACVFSPESAPNWSVFVEATDGFIGNESGACFALLKDANCGKSRLFFEQCLDFTCSEDDCQTSTKQQKCYGDTQSGACKDVTTAYSAACPNEKQLIDACGNMYKAMAVACAGGADAGIDAAPP